MPTLVIFFMEMSVISLLLIALSINVYRIVRHLRHESRLVVDRAEHSNDSRRQSASRVSTEDVSQQFAHIIRSGLWNPWEQASGVFFIGGNRDYVVARPSRQMEWGTIDPYYALDESQEYLTVRTVKPIALLYEMRKKQDVDDYLKPERIRDEWDQLLFPSKKARESQVRFSLKLQQ